MVDWFLVFFEISQDKIIKGKEVGAMPTGKLTKESAYREGVLQYFNRTLMEQGVISEADYKEMQMKIRSAYAPVRESKYRYR